MIKSIANSLMSNKVGLISVVTVEMALVVGSYIVASGVTPLV
jgi:hypothetical protein